MSEQIPQGRYWLIEAGFFTDGRMKNNTNRQWTALISDEMIDEEEELL